MQDETTSLSSLDHHNWMVVSNRWAQFGAQNWVGKEGRKWSTNGPFAGFPLFTTKKAACNAIDTLILWESRLRTEANRG